MLVTGIHAAKLADSSTEWTSVTSTEVTRAFTAA